MDSDSYYPFKVRAAQILGLMKLAAKSIETNGIQLLEGSKGEGHETKNTIQWILNSTKGIKERIYGLSTQEEAVHNLILEVLGITPEENNKLTITASDEGNVNGGVSVTVKGISRTILNKLGGSNFLQLAGNAAVKQKLVTGWVAANGTLGAGTGFTVEKVAIGRYKITFTEAFSGTPIVVGSDIQGTQRTFAYSVTSASIINVVMAPSAGVPEDIAFSFIAVG